MTTADPAPSTAGDGPPAAAPAAPAPAAPSGAETAATFAIEDEDHTLANALRFMLNKNPRVTFCGYSIPHPSEAVVNMRIQTTGEISAAEALRQACVDLKAACGHIRTTFAAALETGEAGAPIPDAPPAVPRAKRAGGPEAAAAAAATAAALAALGKADAAVV